MGSLLDQALAEEMAEWEARGLRRELQVADPLRDPRYDFASNDYLSLARDPRIVAAAREALERYGAGGRAARLLGGGSPLDERAESAAADWLRADAALLFPSGYQANLGVVGALVGRGDAVISDERNHASLIDAAALSRARVFVHRHVDLADVERCLRAASSARRRLLLTESVFSMDGDAAPLGQLHELCARYDAWLVVDEAHAIGLVGPEGAGAWAGIDPGGKIARSRACRLAARIVTGGKALGVGGGLAVGSSTLRRHLIQHARTFVFTTAPIPAIAGALAASIGIVRAEPGPRASALAHARALAQALDLPEPAAAIVPWIAGSSERALAIAAALSRSGFDVRAVRPPTVAEGSARLRLVCHAHNDGASIAELAAALHDVPRPTPPAASAGPTNAARPLFVAGTDTGVGKTVIAALLTRAAARRGPSIYWKPVQTGPASDTDVVGRLTAASGARLREPAYSFALAAAPDAAARAAGGAVELGRLRSELTVARESAGAGRIVVELAGGLLVPYDDACTQLDWLALEGEPLVLVARSGLGTLNHTLLSFEALDARQLLPRALFLVGDPHPSNRATLERRTRVPVYAVERFDPLDAGALERWIDAHDLAPVLGENA